MKVTLKGAVDSVPSMDSTLQKEVVQEALHLLARRLARVQNANGLEFNMGDLTIEMPVSLTRVRTGYYTTKAAATFLAHDVTDEDRWREVISDVQAREGGLHVLRTDGVEG